MMAAMGTLVATRRARARRLDLVLAGIGIAGTIDVAQFLAANDGMFRAAPGRAAGSVLGLAIWAGLTSVAIASATGADSRSLNQATVSLAALAALGGVGLAAVHAAAHVGGWRPALGGVLGLGALGIALGARAARGG